MKDGDLAMNKQQQSLLTRDLLQVPPVMYRKLQEQGPLFYDPEKAFWIACGAETVSQILRHPDISSKRPTLHGKRYTGRDKELVQEQVNRLTHGGSQSIIGLDPPEHTRLRSMVSHLMSREKTREWKPLIENAFTRLLEPGLEQGGMDFVNDICEHYPMNVIGELFAIPKQLQGKYCQRSCLYLRFIGHSLDCLSLSEITEAVSASIANRNMLIGLLEQRCQQPGEDLLSELTVHINSGQASLPEMAVMANLLVTAGYVTTVDLLANGVYQLLGNPDQWQLLVENPDLADNAVEEILRYDSSVAFIFRRAGSDIVIDDICIPRDSYIAVGLGAANHDPELNPNPNPERFDITRNSIRHVSFGQGLYVCMGAHLARMEIGMALKVLAQRAPSLKFAEEPEPYMKNDTLMFKGFHALPLLC